MAGGGGRGGGGEGGSGDVRGQVMSGLKGRCWSSSSCARISRANYIETTGRDTYHLTRRGTSVCECVEVTQRRQAGRHHLILHQDNTVDSVPH